MIISVKPFILFYFTHLCIYAPREYDTNAFNTFIENDNKIILTLSAPGYLRVKKSGKDFRRTLSLTLALKLMLQTCNKNDINLTCCIYKYKYLLAMK